MKILLFAADISENSLGRVYVLWMLARELGFEVKTVAKLGSEIWKPLAQTEFGRSVRPLGGISRKELEDLARSSDLLIGCKPRPESAGIAIRLSKKVGTPVLIDVDDPDLEFQFDFLTAPDRLRRWFRPVRRLGYWRIRRSLHRYPVLVSNPVLQRKYGGWLVPHARRDPGEQLLSGRRTPVVAFVGTVLPHKGLGDLRAAISRLNDPGEPRVRLQVTAPPPDDVAHWEDWVGVTTLERGLSLVQQADIIVLPSHAGSWSDMQLPAKLMDAMLAGKAVCVSDLEPMRWAVGDAGIVFPPADVEAIELALQRLLHPETRIELGTNARQRAIKLFTVEAVSGTFSEAVFQASGNWAPIGDKVA